MTETQELNTYAKIVSVQLAGNGLIVSMMANGEYFEGSLPKAFESIPRESTMKADKSQVERLFEERPVPFTQVARCREHILLHLWDDPDVSYGRVRAAWLDEQGLIGVEPTFSPGLLHAEKLLADTWREVERLLDTAAAQDRLNPVLAQVDFSPENVAVTMAEADSDAEYNTSVLSTVGDASLRVFVILEYSRESNSSLTVSYDVLQFALPPGMTLVLEKNGEKLRAVSDEESGEWTIWGIDNLPDSLTGAKLRLERA